MAEGIRSEVEKNQKARQRILLLINVALLGVGGSGAPLETRLYFLHGGQRMWLGTFLLTAGFPVMLIPLIVSYVLRRRSAAAGDGEKPKLINMTPPMILGFGFIGVLNGVGNYLYSYGLAGLPVSTSSLIIASQLGFTAIFAFFMVRQKFTPFSINAVVLLTLGAGILALHGGSDRPAGEPSKKYVLAFVMTILAAVMTGFTLPLVELMYRKTKTITYQLVMELQVVICFFSTLFAVVGMLASHDFQVIASEARVYGLGEVKYYVVLVTSALLWQLYLLGSVGVIFCSSSLFSGIILSLLLPVTEVLAVIFYKEKFQAEKGVSLALSIWGFVSYFYGEFKQTKKTQNNHITETELPVNHSINVDP